MVGGHSPARYPIAGPQWESRTAPRRNAWRPALCQAKNPSQIYSDKSLAPPPRFRGFSARAFLRNHASRRELVPIPDTAAPLRPADVAPSANMRLEDRRRVSIQDRMRLGTTLLRNLRRHKLPAHFAQISPGGAAAPLPG